MASIESRVTACCGVKEINGISNFVGRPKDALRRLLKPACHMVGGRYQRGSHAFYTFTQATVGAHEARRLSYGEQLKDAISRYKLGTVTSSPPVRNFNSGNMVKVYVWAIDWPGVTSWLDSL